MSLRAAVLVGSVLLTGIACCQPPFKEWQLNVLSHRPGKAAPAEAAGGASPVPDDGPYFGVTVWRFKTGTTPGDRIAVRFPVVTPIANGQKFRIALEATHAGYLYVVRGRGNTSARLVFPLSGPQGTQNGRVNRSVPGQVLPGQIIQIPTPGEQAPDYTVARTAPEQTSETFTVLFSASPVPELLRASGGLNQILAEMPDTKRLVPQNCLNDYDSAGTPASSAEIKAAAVAGILTPEDPAPQTIYHCQRCGSGPENWYVFEIELPIQRSLVSAMSFRDLSGRIADNTPRSPAPYPGMPKTSPSAGSKVSSGSHTVTSGARNSGGGRVTSRAFLTPRESEQPGYGLYSYLLFGSRPDSLNSVRWQRFEQAIGAFLDIPSAAEVARYVASERTNVSFIPVNVTPVELPVPESPRAFNFNPDRLASHAAEHKAAGRPAREGADSACMLVSNYDYARAEALLSMFAEGHGEGPYIVSVSQPLSRMQTPPQQYLFQDLSSVPPELVLLWVQEFIAQSREQEFWKTRTKEQFILRLRTNIGIASNQVSDFAGAIKWTFAAVTPSGGR